MARQAFYAQGDWSGTLHADYLSWLSVSLRFLGSHGTNVERKMLYPRVVDAVWSTLLGKLACPVPEGGFEDMHATTVQRFLPLLPSPDDLLDDIKRGNGGAVRWKEYLSCLQFTPAPSLPPSTLTWQFAHFVAMYFQDRDTVAQRDQWDNISALSTWMDRALVDEFVLCQLFSFLNTMASAVPQLPVVHNPSHAIRHVGAMEKPSIVPLLQLDKVSPLQHVQTQDVVVNPMDELTFWCSADMYVEFVLYLFNMVVATTDDRSLHPTYCGRFGGSIKGFDALFWLQLRLDAPKCQHVVPQLALRVTDSNRRRLESKLRLLKLAASTLSARAIFFRGFDSPRHGAFGTIYRCTSDLPLFRVHSKTMRESIALKVLATQKFPHERSILYCLYDYGQSKEGYYIAMEFADLSLKEWRDANASTVDVDTLLAVFSKVFINDIAGTDGG
ncbi:hypothetical protein DYB32_000702 [Aphanomyces invadans]|uniref:Protein kinase domain-containing protein n=1 Tax=Aphanomyces invadans TaxID=157072 RepID=A0A3R6WTF4_9STRA|nr:hypothetical protein DYB32_000702 [Aphanomyces invadans]